MSYLLSSVRSKPPASSPLSPFSGVLMAEIKHRSVRTNGITMHLAEQGEGPLGPAGESARSGSARRRRSSGS